MTKTAKGLTAETGEATAPTSVSGDISVPGPGAATKPYTFSLPDEVTAGSAAQATDDTIVYGASKATDTSLAVRLGNGVLQQVITIKDAAASHAYTFHVDSRLTPSPSTDGDVMLTSKGEAGAASALNASVAKAWALDANAKPVPTHYEVRQGSIVQVIDFTADTAFPVTADPTYWYWWGERIVSTWSQTKQIKAFADAGNYGYAPWFCGIFGIAAGAACGLVMTAGINAISNQARYGVAHGKCLYEDVPFVGAPRVYTGTCPGTSGGGGV
ncbi:hypothetical protein [Microbacterium mangrovi]|uniref:hypothetical protein n=1 Tax=Microbacterium mangrovi TaxID=1348253 RepID=UPI0012E06654|nr:hypothetical protein [Microbacterium mangrovi]